MWIFAAYSSFKLSVLLYFSYELQVEEHHIKYDNIILAFLFNS